MEGLSPVFFGCLLIQIGPKRFFLIIGGGREGGSKTYSRKHSYRVS